MSRSSSPSPHSCPRCRTPMLLGHAGGMALHGCASCGGIWLGSACAQRFSREIPHAALELAAHHSQKAKNPVDTTLSIPCPVCGTTMQRTRAAAAALDLDFCGRHGTWYDRHEMERIGRAISTTRWNQENVAIVAAPLGPSTQPNENGADVVDTAIEGADVALEVLDHADAGVEVVGGVFEFFTAIFD